MCDPNKIHLPAQKFCDKWAAHANRHPGEAHPKIHDPGGHPTGFEGPCRTLDRLCLGLPTIPLVSWVHQLALYGMHSCNAAVNDHGDVPTHCVYSLGCSAKLNPCVSLFCCQHWYNLRCSRPSLLTACCTVQHQTLAATAAANLHCFCCCQGISKYFSIQFVWSAWPGLISS